MITDLFVFPQAVNALLTSVTFGRQMEGRKTWQSLVVLSIMMTTGAILYVCLSSHVNHVPLSAVCASAHISTTDMTLCRAPLCHSLLIHVYLTLDSVCLPVSFRFPHPAAGQSLNNGAGGAMVSGETPPLLPPPPPQNWPGCCVIIRLIHTCPACVSQYMEQMAGRVFNKHKYMLIISLGYSQLLLLLCL